MKTNHETGNIKNITHFQELITFCEGFGEKYNPSSEALKIPQLQSLLDEVNHKFSVAKDAKRTFDNATNERRNAFAELKTFSTKIINAFAVSGASKLDVDDAKAINKKIQGTKSRKKTNPTTNLDSASTTKTISTSQQSYDFQVDHFSNFISLLQLNSKYSPNEEELKIASLQNKLNDLKSKNENLSVVFSAYNNSLIDRNKTLYNPLSGLVQIAKDVKSYVKSVYGHKSSEYKKISKLQFKLRKGNA